MAYHGLLRLNLTALQDALLAIHAGPGILLQAATATTQLTMGSPARAIHQTKW